MAWFDRLTPAAVCVSAVAAASGLAAAAEAGSRVAVVDALAGAVAPLSLLLVVVTRRRRPAERAWDGGQVRVAARSPASSDPRGAQAGTDALLAEAGLPSAGPFDQVVSRDPGSC
ncbi:MAG: hypothetical protein ABIS47_01425 [Acidimicrobiales bacterium]